LKLIELGNGRAVLTVYIPDNQETPFISRDGRIYRREGDSSSPVHETNRYAVVHLVEKGRDIARQFERFCRDERTFCQAEEGQGWVSIFVSPYPTGMIDKKDILSDKGIDALIQLSQQPIGIRVADSEIGSGNLPLNSGQAALAQQYFDKLDQPMWHSIH
jgi:hypothetical protein